MDFGPLFFDPHIIDSGYGFWPKFDHNTIHYGCCPNFC